MTEETKWSQGIKKFTNPDQLYKNFLDKAGIKSIQHYNLMLFGDPYDQSFLKEIQVVEHLYSLGDRLSKLAHREYGDPRYWWVLAWFNGKPTELHCQIGDTIEIPHPLEEVLIQAFNKIEL